MINFKAVGISYHDAPLDIREQVALSDAESNDLLISLRDTLGITETLIVSTCNRTEVYYTSNSDLSNEIVSLLLVKKSVENPKAKGFFKTYLASDEAIAHLFDVSLGLDSKVLGDIQISNQVKVAYQQSTDLGLAGPFLHRLMHTIFFANKRVVQETRLQDGNASLASVSVDLTKRFIENVANPKILLIGLGEIGQNVLENLNGVEAEISLINRTKAKAEEFAKNTSYGVEEFDRINEVIPSNDVIICAVQGGELIKKEIFDSAEFHHKLFIDLSVPRSIQKELGELKGVSLYNVDQLEEKTQKVKKVRNAAIPQVKEIISEAMIGFNEWKEEMEVSPTIQKLKKALDDIRKQELSRHIGKVSDSEMALLESVTKNMIQKVIKLPVLQLKAACRRGESENLVDVINDLFNLEPDEVNINK